MYTKIHRKTLGISFVLVTFLVALVLPLINIGLVAAIPVGGSGGPATYTGSWLTADTISVAVTSPNQTVNVPFAYSPTVYKDSSGTYYDMFYDTTTSQCKDALMFSSDPAGDSYPQLVNPTSINAPCAYDTSTGTPVVITNNQPAAAYLTAISPITATYNSTTYGGNTGSILSNGNKDVTLETPIAQTGPLDPSELGCFDTMLVNNYQSFPPTSLTATVTTKNINGSGEGRLGVTVKCNQASQQSVPFFVSLSLYSSSADGNPFHQPVTPAGSSTTNSGCPITDGDALTWVLCPVADLAQTAMGILSGWLKSFLYVPASTINDFEATSNTFRDIGEALLVIAGLAMVVSQAAGLEIFAAYTIRKALPRIILAAIGMALAWPILLFVITFFNDIGYWTQTLILEAAKVPQAGNPSTAFTNLMEGVGLLSGGTVVAGALIIAIAVAGAAVIISLLGTMVLALFIGLLVLTIRQLVIIVCVILAPLAIAAAVLPGTAKLWNFWRTTLLTTMMMFPIIMSVIGAGMALSYIAGQEAKSTGSMAWDFMAIAALIVPFVMLPLTFKMAGGLMGVVSGAVSNNGLVKGGFGAISAYRKNEFAYRHQQTMEGKSKLGSSPFGGLYRRAVTRGGISLSHTGRARYAEFERQRLGAAAGEAVEKGGAAAGDDIATSLAQDGSTTYGNWVERYRAQAAIRYPKADPVTEEQARAALGTLESGFGSRLGSSAMQVAAFRAKVTSGTAYEATADGVRELITDSGRMVKSGLMTTSDAVMAIKSNRSRPDQAGVGFPILLTGISDAAAGKGVSDDTVAGFRKTAVSNLQPAALVGARPEAITALMPTMRSNIEAAYKSGNQEDIDHQLGFVAGIQDYLSANAPQNADLVAKELMHYPVPAVPGQTATKTVAQAIDEARDRSTFREVRNETGHRA